MDRLVMAEPMVIDLHKDLKAADSLLLDHQELLVLQEQYFRIEDKNFVQQNHYVRI